MDKNYHIFSDGRIERSEDTVRLVTEDDGKKHIPIEHAEALFLHGQIDFNTRLMSFLNKQGVAMHVFGWNDYYSGSIMPKRGQNSGRTVVAQVRAYEDGTHRRQLASAFVTRTFYNPQICELKYTIFLFCSDTLWLILSTYLPSFPCLFFSD